LVRTLKERITDKPVYALVVLPFVHEESEPNVFSNTASCLASANSVADAVILAENQRFMSKEASLKTSLQKINQSIVEPLFSVVASAGDSREKAVGNPLTISDLIATLDGWSAIGYAETNAAPLSLRRDDLLRREVSTEQAVHLMNAALAEMSLTVRPADAYNALFLVSGSPRELGSNVDEIMEAYMKQASPKARIKGGEYAHDKALEVAVILSNFGETADLKRYREKAKNMAEEREFRGQTRADREALMEDLGRDIPDL
jgi:tubulin-like protein CetZ